MKLKLILSLAILNLIGSANAEVKLTPEAQAFFENARQKAEEAFEYAKTAGGKLLEEARTRLESAKQELAKPNLAKPNLVAAPAVATRSILTRAKEAVVNAATKAKDAVSAVPSRVKTGCEDLVNSKCVQAQVKFVQNHKVAVGVTAAVAVAAAIAYAVKKNKANKKN